MKLLRSDQLVVKRIVNSLFTSCTYLLYTEGGVWMVDCGDVEPLLPLLHDSEVKGVLLTHAHFDHIYGLNELLERYGNAVVVTNEAGREALMDDKKNMSFFHEMPFTLEHSENIMIANDGDEISLSDGIWAKVVATPGHHPSCLTYLLNDLLFTGDSYIPGVKVVTVLPQGNKNEARQSLDRIKALSEGKTIYPGHLLREKNEK